MKMKLKCIFAAVFALAILSSCGAAADVSNESKVSEQISAVSQQSTEKTDESHTSDKPESETSEPEKESSEDLSSAALPEESSKPESSYEAGSSEQEESVSDTEESLQSEAECSADNGDDIIPSPYCRSAVLYCADSKEILYNDGADIPTAPASITKLLTASVLLEHMDSEDIVTVGTELELVNPGSSICFISEGNRLTVRDLLTGMLMNSGNDAAYTAAVSAARAANPEAELSNEEAVGVFVEMMNELAARIGMSSSQFANPDGWDDDAQYVTAADLAKLSEYALNDPVIKEIVSTHQKYVVFESGESITWTNTNSLLDPESEYYCENAIGMKTGTTDSAGCCLAAAFNKDGKTYITVVTGCYESDDRYDMTLKVFAKAK